MSKIIVNKSGNPLMNQNGVILTKNTDKNINFIPEITVTEITTDSPFLVEPNTFYVFENIYNDFSLELSSGQNSNFLEYAGQIYVDELKMSVTFPSGIIWKTDGNVTVNNNKLTLDANRTYVYSICNRLGIILSFENGILEKVLPLNVRTETISGIVYSYTTDNWISRDEQNLLTWEPIANADYYEIYAILSKDTGDYIGGMTITYPTPTEIIAVTESNSIKLDDYFTNKGHYVVLIKAKSTKFVDSVSDLIHYSNGGQLAAPSNLILNSDSGVLSWDIVPNADGYTVYLEDAENNLEPLCTQTGSGYTRITSANYLDLTDQLIATIVDGNATYSSPATGILYNIRVKASNSSNPVTFPPSEFSTETVSYTW